jgi:hypothetical protein
LLFKWWWKLETQDGLWQTIVKAKYFRNKSVASVKARMSDFPCWKAIMKVKDEYLLGRKIILHKGDIVRFWLDPSLNNLALCVSYPELYNISKGQEFTFERYVNSGFDIPFRRRLSQVLSV